MPNQQPNAEDENLKSCCRYGWCNYRPQFLQTFRHPWVALTILSTCAFIQGFLVSGLVNVCISSVEKQFKLTSTQTGSVVSAYDIAFLIFATPISYMGGRPGVSKVRYLTMGMISLGLGSLVFASPQFMSSPYAYRSVSETCTLKTSSQTMSTIHSIEDNLHYNKAFPYYFSFLSGSFLNGLGGSPLYTLGITYIDENSPDDLVSLYLGIYYAFSILGPAFGFFFGAYVLTFYVDFIKYTHFPHSNTYKWISNNLLSGQTPGPNWVGAWWLSFVTCTAFAWTMAIPLSGLPSRFPHMLEKFVARHRKMESKAVNNIVPQTRTSIYPPRLSLQAPSDQASSSTTTNNSLLSRLKLIYGSMRSNTATLFSTMRSLPKPTAATNGINDNASRKNSAKSTIVIVDNSKGGHAFYKSLKSLITNGTFMCITLAGAADGFILNGFAAFLPKYLEMQFGLSAKQASLYVGYATIPAGVLGMLLGGYVIKRFNVSVLGMIKITFIASLCNFTCLLVLLMTCPENKLAGVNYMPTHLRPPKAYINTTLDYETWFTRRQSLSNEAKIDFECNHDCNCHYTYDPVCGSDVMYYSACHAGCHTKLSSDKAKQIVYYNCTCIVKGFNGKQGEAKPGACPTTCGNLLLFLTFIFFSLFLLLMVAVIAVMITLKCVGSHENSLSMGVQWAFVRLLGTIPGPIIFGKIIDRNCLFWEVKSVSDPTLNLVEPSLIISGNENGACKLYNNYAMGRDLFYLMVFSKMTSQVFYGLACFIYSRTFLTAPKILVENKETPKEEAPAAKRPFESLRVTTYPDLRGLRVDRGTFFVNKSMSADSLKLASRPYKSTWSPNDRHTTYSK